MFLSVTYLTLLNSLRWEHQGAHLANAGSYVVARIVPDPKGRPSRKHRLGGKPQRGRSHGKESHDHHRRHQSAISARRYGVFHHPPACWAIRSDRNGSDRPDDHHPGRSHTKGSRHRVRLPEERRSRSLIQDGEGHAWPLCTPLCGQAHGARELFGSARYMFHRACPHLGTHELPVRLRLSVACASR